MSHALMLPFGPATYARQTQGQPCGTQLFGTVLAAVALSALILPHGVIAQDQLPENPYEAPQLIAPTGGETISSAGAIRLRWRPADGSATPESERYNQLLQRLVVEQTTDAGDAQPLRFVRTYAIATAGERPSTPDARPTYPTVGDWYPDTAPPPRPQDTENVWTVHLPHPLVGAWFPYENDQTPLPKGSYTWNVQLVGETANGTREVLASSQTATFTVTAPSEATPAVEEPSSPDDLSARGPDQVSITLMPRGGLFLSGVSSLEDISGEAGAALGGEKSVLTLGGSIAFGSRDGPANLRITGLHTTGSLVSTQEGTTSPADFRRESILALTGDLVVRPLPRLLVQPYAIGGLGARRIAAPQRDEIASHARWDLAAQIGVGADLRLGNVTLGVEVVDYLTGSADSGNSFQHDAFVFLTLGIPVY